ncbi:MAG TPA: hypothetical protein VGH88_19390 [Streptosporangiaceae bacterium]
MTSWPGPPDAGGIPPASRPAPPPAGSLPARTAARPELAAAGVALAAGLALGWAASGPGALAGHDLAGPPRGTGSLAIGGLAVLLAAANGFAKAYSP